MDSPPRFSRLIELPVGIYNCNIHRIFDNNRSSIAVGEYRRIVLQSTLFGELGQRIAISFSDCTHVSADLQMTQPLNVTSSLNRQSRFPSSVTQTILNSRISHSTNHLSGTACNNINQGGSLLCTNSSFSQCNQLAIQPSDEFPSMQLQHYSMSHPFEMPADVTGTDQATCSFQACTFLDISSENDGSAVSISTPIHLCVTNTHFRSCRTTGSSSVGGAISMASEDKVGLQFTCQESSFRLCSSKGSAGSLFLDSVSTTSFSRSFFFESSAAVSGGAVFARNLSNSFTFDNSTFSTCKAINEAGTGTGGAFFVDTSPDVFMNYLIFTENGPAKGQDIYFEESGEIWFIFGPNFRINNSHFRKYGCLMTRLEIGSTNTVQTSLNIPSALNLFCLVDNTDNYEPPNEDSPPPMQRLLMLGRSTPTQDFTQSVAFGEWELLQQGSKYTLVAASCPACKVSVGPNVFFTTPNQARIVQAIFRYDSETQQGYLRIKGRNINKPTTYTLTITTGDQFEEEVSFGTSEEGSLNMLSFDTAADIGGENSRYKWDTTYTIKYASLKNEQTSLVLDPPVISFTTPSEPKPTLKTIETSYDPRRVEMLTITLLGSRIPVGQYTLTVRTGINEQINITAEFAQADTGTALVALYDKDSSQIVLKSDTQYVVEFFYKFGSNIPIPILGQLSFTTPQQPPRVTSVSAKLTRKDEVTVTLEGTAFDNKALLMTVQKGNEEITSPSPISYETGLATVTFKVSQNADPITGTLAFGVTYTVKDVKDDTDFFVVNTGVAVEVPNSPRLTSVGTTSLTGTLKDTVIIPLIGAMIPEGDYTLNVKDSLDKDIFLHATFKPDGTGSASAVVYSLEPTEIELESDTSYTIVLLVKKDDASVDVTIFDPLSFATPQQPPRVISVTPTLTAADQMKLTFSGKAFENKALKVRVQNGEGTTVHADHFTISSGVSLISGEHSFLDVEMTVSGCTLSNLQSDTVPLMTDCVFTKATTISNTSTTDVAVILVRTGQSDLSVTGFVLLAADLPLVVFFWQGNIPNDWLIRAHVVTMNQGKKGHGIAPTSIPLSITTPSSSATSHIRTRSNQGSSLFVRAPSPREGHPHLSTLHLDPNDSRPITPAFTQSPSDSSPLMMSLHGDPSQLNQTYGGIRGWKKACSSNPPSRPLSRTQTPVPKSETPKLSYNNISLKLPKGKRQREKRPRTGAPSLHHGTTGTQDYQNPSTESQNGRFSARYHLYSTHSYRDDSVRSKSRDSTPPRVTGISSFEPSNISPAHTRTTSSLVLNSDPATKRSTFGLDTSKTPPPDNIIKPTSPLSHTIHHFRPVQDNTTELPELSNNSQKKVKLHLYELSFADQPEKTTQKRNYYEDSLGPPSLPLVSSRVYSVRTPQNGIPLSQTLPPTSSHSESISKASTYSTAARRRELFRSRRTYDSDPASEGTSDTDPVFTRTVRQTEPNMGNEKEDDDFGDSEINFEMKGKAIRIFPFTNAKHTRRNRHHQNEVEIQPIARRDEDLLPHEVEHQTGQSRRDSDRFVETFGNVSSRRAHTTRNLPSSPNTQERRLNTKQSAPDVTKPQIPTLFAPSTQTHTLHAPLRVSAELREWSASSPIVPVLGCGVEESGSVVESVTERFEAEEMPFSTRIDEKEKAVEERRKEEEEERQEREFRDVLRTPVIAEVEEQDNSKLVTPRTRTLPKDLIPTEPPSELPSLPIIRKVADRKKEEEREEKRQEEDARKTEVVVKEEEIIEREARERSFEDDRSTSQPDVSPSVSIVETTLEVIGRGTEQREMGGTEETEPVSSLEEILQTEITSEPSAEDIEEERVTQNEKEEEKEEEKDNNAETTPPPIVPNSSIPDHEEKIDSPAPQAIPATIIPTPEPDDKPRDVETDPTPETATPSVGTQPTIHSSSSSVVSLEGVREEDDGERRKAEEERRRVEKLRKEEEDERRKKEEARREAERQKREAEEKRRQMEAIRTKRHSEMTDSAKAVLGTLGMTGIELLNFEGNGNAGVMSAKEVENKKKEENALVSPKTPKSSKPQRTLKQHVTEFDLVVNRFMSESGFSLKETTNFLDRMHMHQCWEDQDIISQPVPTDLISKLSERLGKRVSPSVAMGCVDVDAMISPDSFVSFVSDELDVDGSGIGEYLYWNLVLYSVELTQNHQNTRATGLRRAKGEIDYSVPPIVLSRLLGHLDAQYNRSKQPRDKRSERIGKVEGEEKESHSFSVGGERRKIQFLAPIEEEEKIEEPKEIDTSFMFSQMKKNTDNGEAYREEKRKREEARRAKEREERGEIENDYSWPFTTEYFFLSLRGLLLGIGGVFKTMKEVRESSIELVKKEKKEYEDEPEEEEEKKELTREERIAKYYSDLEKERTKQTSKSEHTLTTSSPLSTTFIASPTQRFFVTVRFVFRLFDWDQDGVISGTDATQVLTALAQDVMKEDISGITQSVFVQFDADGDGKLNFKDFTRTHHDSQNGTLPQKLLGFVRRVFIVGESSVMDGIPSFYRNESNTDSGKPSRSASPEGWEEEGDTKGQFVETRPSSPFKFDPSSDKYFGRWRLMIPDKYDLVMFRRRSGFSGISILMGEHLETGREEPISILFDRALWDEENARVWWASNWKRFRREWRTRMWKERGVSTTKALPTAYRSQKVKKEGVSRPEFAKDSLQKMEEARRTRRKEEMEMERQKRLLMEESALKAEERKSKKKADKTPTIPVIVKPSPAIRPSLGFSSSSVRPTQLPQSPVRRVGESAHVSSGGDGSPSSRR
ncbi:hypothetical protein BLNAU_20785 [Blattamonas nauphoetae]|uniref:EF-hand domain-containing protein n=1 Tax=Blattamonas nauphoetae TaxID=2049346 RepID=A0ABQ9WYS9_9EUKA|nr:hypothetical protein BLNAU_20785 [Blattamonas nauphoetae]